MSNQSRTYLLIEERLGRPLARYVMRLRGNAPRGATSWEQIAHQIATETGIAVTSETLRLWFYAAERKRLAKAHDRVTERAAS